MIGALNLLRWRPATVCPFLMFGSTSSRPAD
jgi:hypothetical protein